MSQPAFDRRQFHQRTLEQLTAAALGGLVAGASVGCSGDNKGAGSAAATPAATPTGTATAVAAAGNIHACRGLNECKGQGVDGKNACAGQGTCATSKHHSCGGQNECKNLGGCGQEAGANACKGMGGCEVPMAHSWKKARENYEKRMKTAGKTFGEAPPEKKA